MTAFTTEQKASIAIVGGGIGGLCLAIALIHNDIPVHVYEAAQAFGEIGAGVGLGPNALRAMAMLDSTVLEAYNNCQTTNVSPAEQGRFFNFRYGMKRPSSDGMRAGELICDVRSGSVTSSVHRARFLNELVKLLPSEKATLGKRLSAIDDSGDGVNLRFEDGSEALHDALVGCDGIKSQVRRILLGPGSKASEPVFTGKYCFRGLASADEAKKILGDEMATESQMYLGTGGHVLTTLIEHGKTVNVVAYTTKSDGAWNHDAWIRPTTKKDMLTNFEGWSDQVKDILKLIQRLDMWALFDHLPAQTFHRKGKICLLGDAAHASTPHHGAGAGMAVEDALVLTRLLLVKSSPRDLDAVFSAYDAVRRPRCQRLVSSSRNIAHIYDLEDPMIGDNMLAMREYLEHAWDWIWKEDLHAQVAKAQVLLAEKSKAAQADFWERWGSMCTIQ